MKKLLCCFLAPSLFLTITTPAMAYSESSLSDSMKTELVKALEIVEGESFHLISTNPEAVPERSILPERSIIKDLNSIHLNSFALSRSLGYSSSSSARAQTYYSLNVGFVYQEENRICWAACAAALVNYLQGESLTACRCCKGVLVCQR